MKNNKKIYKKINILYKAPFYIVAIFLVIIIKIIKPLILVRIGILRSNRIGHFCANTEIYLCEKEAKINTPQQKYIDIFMYEDGQICNKQLKKMWSRVLNIWPSFLIIPILKIINYLPNNKIHKVSNNSQQDRDIHNLYDKIHCHLKFTQKEEEFGLSHIKKMGIKPCEKFICLNVRDNEYLKGSEWDYHNYRDSNIQNYVMVTEMLANQGYFVIRMGAKMKFKIESQHPRVIDYATNGMRNDFMDVYLGAKCEFCISTGSGWDAIPECFRRPIVFVNFVPLIRLHTYSSRIISITKRHVWKTTLEALSCSEIFKSRAGFAMSSKEYEFCGVELIENTPEEICDVVFEMVKRLSGNWKIGADDASIQQSFWDIFPKNAVDELIGNPLHGEIRGLFGSAFLRSNPLLLK